MSWAPSAPRVRRRVDAAVLAAGLGVLGAGMLAVRHGSVSPLEEDVFRAVNDLPGALYPVLWPFQQLGAILVGPLVAIAATAARQLRLGVAVIVATAAKLGLERVVKAVVTRERPAVSVGADVHVRGDVPSAGASFVSGHAVLVAALAGLLTPYLPGRWRIVPGVVVAVVLVARVYVGAHNPLDVVCGAGLGLALAGFLNLVFGVPDRRPR